MSVSVNALSVVTDGGGIYLVNVLEEINRDRRGIRFTFVITIDKVSFPRKHAHRNYGITETSKRSADLRVAIQRLVPDIWACHDHTLNIAYKTLAER